MSTFTYLKRDCPVCNGSRSDCRRNELTGRIHCRTILDSAPDWHLVSEDALGFGIYSDAELETKFDLDAHQRQRQQREQAEREQLQTALPVEQRDREYRSIARRRGLITRHRAELQRRGLTEAEINWLHQHGIVFTWEGGPLDGISANLPGAAGAEKLRNFKGLPLAIAVPSLSKAAACDRSSIG